MLRVAWFVGLFLVFGCGDGGVGEEGASTSADASEGSGSAEVDASESEDESSTSTGQATSAGATTEEPEGSTSSTSEDATTSADSGASTGAAVDVPPTGIDALLPWLQAGEYLDWNAESAPHGSAGPHFGTVRTFVNGPLFDSLAAGGDPHPRDAAAVKELYGDGNEVLGWSVTVKVADGEGGDTWYWLEYYQGTTYADGVGDGLCTGCHGGGSDHVLSPFPLQ
jgi:hypothetical protein